MQTASVHPNTYDKLKAVAEEIKQGIFSKETLIPVSLVLALIGPAVYVANMSQRLEVMENRIEVMQQNTITKEVFQLRLENFEMKLDAVLVAVGSQGKSKKQ